MIDKITLKSSSSIGKPNLEIELTPITVFVGPNNSGKSRILIEIENSCRDRNFQPNYKILSGITFSALTKYDIENEINRIIQEPSINERLNAGHILLGKVNAQNNNAIRVQVDKNSLINEAQNPNHSRYNYTTFLDIYTLRLDGTNRLNLLNEQKAGDLQKTPSNHLAHLFLNNKLLKEVRRIIYDAFEKYYVIDPTNIGNLISWKFA